MSERTNRLAVKAVEEAAILAGWFFREQTISDQGIDAHIERFELVQGKSGDDEVGTGRLIALQIKGGPSYFGRPSPSGWWFHFNARKASLWLGHALPVLITMVDLDTRKIYWQRVSTSTVIKTGKNYKIEVPRSNAVDSLGLEWLEIASGLEQHAMARYELSMLSLPPEVRELLNRRSQPELPDAALLAAHLSEGRENPSGTVRSLLATTPSWLSRNADWSWHVIAAYASAHDLLPEAAEAFRRSADAATDEARKSRELVSAALLLYPESKKEASALLQAAESLACTDNIFLAIAKTVFSRDPRDASPWIIDPLLTSELPGVVDSAAAQQLLATHSRRVENLDGAIQYRRRAMDLDPFDHESANQLAQCLLDRWILSGASATDLREAIDLLEKLITERRRWSGPIGGPIAHLARAFASSGQYEKVLQLILIPPHGGAEPMNLDRSTIRLAAYSARFLGRDAAFDAACELLGDEPADLLVRVSVGALELASNEISTLRLQVLEESLRMDNFAEVARLSITLASEGIDVRDKLEDLVARSIFPSRVTTLISALLGAFKNLDGALPELREIAKTDASAGDQLILLLRKAGRTQEAADTAASLYEVTGSEAYLIIKADCLIEVGAGAEAVEAAEVAVSQTTIMPRDRSRLLTFLAGKAADSRNWSAAERYLLRVLELFDKPSDSDVWRLVIALTNQGRVAKAARIVAKYRPEVRSRDEAEVWFRAHAALRWNEEIAFEAFALAERFEDDPVLSSALLGSLITSTNGVVEQVRNSERAAGESGELAELDEVELDERRSLAQDSVPGDLHRRAFELMERLSEKHGDRAGISVVHGSDLDDLVTRLVEVHKKASQIQAGLYNLIELVENSRIPLGFLAGVMKRSYATLVAQRSMGVLVAASADNSESDIESAAARGSFNREVVVDAASVVTLTGLRDPARLSGRYLSLVTPPAAMLGLHRSIHDIRGLAGSPGSTRWDMERQALIFTELSDDEFRRIYDRSSRISDYTERLSVRAVTAEGSLWEFADKREHDEWADVLRLALETKLAIWSDDLGLRRMARELGVAAFGTPSVIEAIRDLALEQSTSVETDEFACEEALSAQVELAADMIVDLPLGVEGLLRLSEACGWNARSGATAIARAAWWINYPDALSNIRRIYGVVSEKSPDELLTWQYGAMLGVARAFKEEVAAVMLAVLALMPFDGNEPPDEWRFRSFHRARQVASEFSLPDPVTEVAAATAVLGELGCCFDPQSLATRVLAAVELGEAGGIE